MKTTGRDIWAIPPGGFRSRPRRNWIRPTIAAGLVLSLGVGGGAIYASMKRSTAVTTQDAIARFRAGSASGGAGVSASTQRSPKVTNGKRSDGPEQRASGAKRSQDQSRHSAGAVASASEADTSAGAGTSQRSDEGRQRKRASMAPTAGTPEEGVYTWDISGVERGPGVERRLPRRSHRIITVNSENTWVEHHIYSEQKEQWFDLGVSDQGVAVSAVRNRVEMGPVEVDRTVTYDPPAYVSRFPFEVGQQWQGTWDGPTRGTYKGETIDHGTLTIGGKSVEVWVTEVHMQMRGEVEGTVITRSWVAPDYNLVVKQYQETDVKSGPGNYYCEWEGQLTSLRPER